MVHRCFLCKETRRGMFLFPKDPFLRAQWLDFCGFSETDIRKSSKICSKHFEKGFITKWEPRPLLFRDAIPSLYGCRKQASSEGNGLCDEEQPVNNTHNETCISVAQERIGSEDNEIVSTPSQTHVDGNVEQQSIECNIALSDMALKDVAVPTLTEPSISMHVPSQQSTTRLSKKYTQKTLDRIHHYQRTIKMYRQRCKRLELKRAKRNLQETTILEQSTKLLDEDSQTLLAAQLQMGNVNKYGRRFSKELKDIALSIYYLSPKAYKFLCKILCLPTIRTLRSYQSSFPNNSELNSRILKIIKEKLSNVDALDRVSNIASQQTNSQREIYRDPNRDSENVKDMNMELTIECRTCKTKGIRNGDDFTEEETRSMSPNSLRKCIDILKKSNEKKSVLIKKLRTQESRHMKRIGYMKNRIQDLEKNKNNSQNAQPPLQV